MKLKYLEKVQNVIKTKNVKTCPKSVKKLMKMSEKC